MRSLRLTADLLTRANMIKLRPMKRLLITLSALALLVPLGAQAASFLGGERLRETTEAIESDLYIASSTVAVLHPVRDDVFAAGENVSIDADVGGDVFAAGNSIRINGRVKDDVLAAGNDVQIRTVEADDIMAAGANVRIESKTVTGSVLAAGDKIRIAGTIAGDVRTAGSDVVIASGTTIAGDLVTYGEREPVMEEGASVGGEVRHEQVERGQYSRGDQARIGNWVRSVVTWFAAGVLLLYLFRGATAEVLDQGFARSGRSLGIGVLAAVLVLPAVLLLALTVVGLPLAALVLLLAGAHLIVAHAFATLLIGSWVMTRFFKAAAASGLKWQHVLLGAVLLKTAALVPIVGWLTVCLLTLLAWGALLQVLWRRLSAQPVPAPPSE